MGCVFPMVVVSKLPHAEFGPNDHREDTPHFMMVIYCFYLRFILAKLASFTIIYNPNIITTPHKIAGTKCCSDRSRASSLSKTVFFGGVAPFFHSFLRISKYRICILEWTHKTSLWVLFKSNPIKLAKISSSLSDDVSFISKSH